MSGEWKSERGGAGRWWGVGERGGGFGGRGGKQECQGQEGRITTRLSKGIVRRDVERKGMGEVEAGGKGKTENNKPC
jgi:hypothetical protein